MKYLHNLMLNSCYSIITSVEDSHTEKVYCIVIEHKAIKNDLILKINFDTKLSLFSAVDPWQ